MMLVEEEFADGRFSAGFGRFREVVTLSRGYSMLEARVATFAIEQAERWMPKDWRLAKSLLLEASEVSSRQAAVSELSELIQQHEREESIRQALKSSEHASSDGMATLALERLAVWAEKYPSDLRIQCRLQAIEALYASQSEDRKRHRSKDEIEAAKRKRLVLAEATRARARECERVGFYSDALEYWSASREIDPLYPDLQEEIARCAALHKGSKSASQMALVRYEAPGAVVKYGAAKRGSRARSVKKRWRWLRGLSRPTAERIGVISAIAFAVLALTVLGWFAWRNVSSGIATQDDAKTVPSVTPAPRVVNTPPAAAAPSAPATAMIRMEMPPALHVKVKPAKPKYDIATAARRGDSKQPSSDNQRIETAPAQPNENRTQTVMPSVQQSTQVDSVAPAAKPQTAIPESKSRVELETNADDEAWSAVNERSADSIQSYLNRFPGGTYRPQAIRALEGIQSETSNRQSSEVKEVVRRYASAWNARDVDSILALQRSLDRRTVKAELSPIKSLVMSIFPAAEPTMTKAIEQPCAAGGRFRTF